MQGARDTAVAWCDRVVSLADDEPDLFVSLPSVGELLRNSRHVRRGGTTRRPRPRPAEPSRAARQPLPRGQRGGRARPDRPCHRPRRGGRASPANCRNRGRERERAEPRRDRHVRRPPRTSNGRQRCRQQPGRDDPSSWPSITAPTFLAHDHQHDRRHRSNGTRRPTRRSSSGALRAHRERQNQAGTWTEVDAEVSIRGLAASDARRPVRCPLPTRASLSTRPR